MTTSHDDNKPPKGDYEVGYGRPPKHSRWKPGQSGNPSRGRPKGTRNLKTDVLAVLKEPVQLKSGGKVRRVSTQHAMLQRLREKALGGDARALDRLIQLAGLYNDEAPVDSGELSDSDAAIFKMFGSGLLEELGAAAEDARPDRDAERSRSGDDRRDDGEDPVEP